MSGWSILRLGGGAGGDGVAFVGVQLIAPLGQSLLGLGEPQAEIGALGRGRQTGEALRAGRKRGVLLLMLGTLPGARPAAILRRRHHPRRLGVSMGLWDKITGEFIDIVEWTEDRPDLLVHRFERYQNEIKMGARLTVREGQLAVMVNEGQLGKGQVADVFSPGMYTLTTENMPILTTLKGWRYGFDSPFKAEVYFFNTRIFTDLKWGTPGPATMRDPEFGVVRVTAFGLYAIRIRDPKIMLVDLVGTKADFSVADIEENLRGKVGSRIKEVMPEAGFPVIDLESKISLLGARLKEKIAADFEQFGLELTEVQVQDVGLPEEVEKAIDQQGAMRAIGNMQQFAQYQAAQAMRDAAQNPGTAGGVMGMGVGLGLTQTMGGLFQPPAAGAAGAAAVPPPLPGAVSFFVAHQGQQTGPFDLALLQAQVQSGELQRGSLVWRQGMAAWSPAAEQPELAGLFAAVPPPLPPQ